MAIMMKKTPTRWEALIILDDGKPRSQTVSMRMHPTPEHAVNYLSRMFKKAKDIRITNPYDIPPTRVKRKKMDEDEPTYDVFDLLDDVDDLPY